MCARCKVMGILNVTPDSFSDGGEFLSPREAVRRAMEMADEGADAIDIGGESTRPGAAPVGWREEWSRIEPVVRELVPRLSGRIAISIDTYHPETAEKALDSGANIINCVKSGPIPEMTSLCVSHRAALVLPYHPSLSPLPSSSIPLYYDPLIGFGTTREEDLRRLRALPELAKTMRLVVGTSRKRIVRHLAGNGNPRDVLGADVALAVWCAMAGVAMVRVHDVKETVQAMNAIGALRGEEGA